MVTRLLHRCGLDLGSESDLMPPQADNPEGFWEHLGFVAVNDELLNELGGAWDLPPKPDENLADPRLEPLRMKARLLIEAFDSAQIWGWKDPRNSLTLPFWQDLLPGLRTLIVVRNPLEVAHSMQERNGTSYSFGLRLWEIYNLRLLQSASEDNRLITDYDWFFRDPKTELRRIARFAGLPDSKIAAAAALILPRRRHTHFTVDHLIDARVSAKIIELYRTLIAEASPRTRTQAQSHSTSSRHEGTSQESDLVPGSVSRLNALVPERQAQIEQLYGELLAQTEGRHRAEIEKLNAHVRQIEERHKSQVAKLNDHLAKTEKRHNSQVEEFKTHLAKTEQRYKAQIEEISAHYTQEVGQLRERVVQISELLHARSVNLAKSEARGEDLRNRLRQQLKATQRLLRLLDDADEAASRLRASGRWQVANPVAAVKAKLSPTKSRELLGYGHLEKIVASYQKWLASHPETAAIDDQIQSLFSEANSAPAAQKTRNAGAAAVGTHDPPAPTRPIEFPQHQEVEISIIIPVCNQNRYTQACLGSLQEHQGSDRFEVIVVDDCSTDDTAEAVPRIPGVVYLRNDTNSGFIASCNRGAEKARGKYLVFLNNDTIVKDGWLKALVDTFGEQPKAGIVGSKLIYPDGRLQEAGGIIWQDGSGWNYGKFDDPKKPEYNYLREVDYCSAAAFMIPKALFQSVGGFDSRYAPAYYEDTDLAFKVRQTGSKVLYQPLSEVIHYEGATGGTDCSTGTKKYQDVNRSIFAETWAGELRTRPVNGDLTFLRQPRSVSSKTILVIDHHLPMPDRDSGSLRMFQILKLLHQLGHRVTFIPDNLANIAPYTAELQKRGVEVVYHPYVKKVRDYLMSHGSEFDVVILSRCHFARKHIAEVRQYAPQSRIIFDTVDLHFVRQGGEAEVTGDPNLQRKAKATQELEYELLNQSDETWVVSNSERRLLKESWPHKSVEVVSNIVDVPGSNTPFALRRDWLFIGGFQHTPNVDAVLFFVQKIYPLVSEQLADAKFYIIGDNAPPEIVRLANERIIVAGLQRDAGPFFDSVRLSVAPLRFGAGIKGKINQSMAFGVPVVATSVAVEGAELRDREEILIADEPEDFARALIELYESEELWKQISVNGIRKTRALYSPEAARQKLQFLFSDEHFRSLDQSSPVRDQELVVAVTS
jgi:GT2 family glycosyltransferase